MFITQFPVLIRFLALMVVGYVTTFSLFRLIFWLYFSNADDALSGLMLSEALYIGLKFDLRLSLVAVLPLFLLGVTRRLRLFTAPYMMGLARGYLTVVFTAIVLFYIFNFGYYAYLKSPMDATILRFLQDFDTSAHMVWESYPVLWLLLAVGLLGATHYWLVKRLSLYYASKPHPQVSRWRRVGLVTLSSFLVIFGLFAKIAWYPLRWSDAFATGHPFASAVTINPVLYYYETLKNKEVDFDTTQVGHYYPFMAEYLGVDAPDPTTVNFTRDVKATDRQLSSHPNVVIVFLESFAMFKTGIGNNPLDPTPEFDAMVKEGVYFKNFFTPSTGTARSVFTALTGMPDVETVRTSTRNPLIVNQRLIMNQFEGYEKYYFIGGSTSWGNIRGLLSNNIYGLKTYEEQNYESPHNDVWGISDLDLFAEANKVLNQSKRPYIAIIQTSGNHRPYTIPDNHGDFQLSPLKDADVINHGFESAEEFNSFRFMDYSVGDFIKQARQFPDFDNTIFVFYGDHGIHAPTGDHRPAWEEKLQLQGLNVPFLIYAPKLLPARAVDSLASEVDIFPTIAGLTIGNYQNTTLGRDLLDPRFDKQRYVFTITHGVKLQIGVRNEDYYFRMYADSSDKKLHPLVQDNPRRDVSSEHPDIAQQLEDVTRAIFETAKYLRFHNGKEPIVHSRP